MEWFVYRLILTATACLCVSSQLTVSPPELCCGRRLQQASTSAVVDKGQVITAGTYNVVEVLTCTTSTFDLQVWKEVSSNRYELFFSQTIVPDETNEIQTVSLSPALVIADGLTYLVGFASHVQEDQFAVPVTTTDTQMSMLISRPSGNSWTLGYTAFADAVPLPYTFKDYTSLWYCNASTTAECKDSITVGGNNPLPSSKDDLPVPGECCGQGPQGPPGPPGNCGANDALSDYVAQQNGQLKEVIQEVIQMKDILGSIVSESQPRGVCRPHYETQFGDFYCYRFLNNRAGFASSLFACNNDNTSLVAIQRREKEDHIVQMIRESRVAQNQSECFMTGAMYALSTGKWTWRARRDIFSSDVVTIPFTYKNFERADTPKPTNHKDQCMALCVDQYSVYWSKISCHIKLRGICEHPKSCY